MKISIPKETHPGETRVAMIPQIVEKLVKMGATIEVEAHLGDAIGISDEAYSKAGAKIQPDRKTLLTSADIILRVRKLPLQELPLLKKGCLHVSFFDPFNDKELILQMVQKGITTVSLEMMPRTTIAQKMDAISSQANLAGYAAVITAAEKIDKVLPMMTTPAGTISPVRVFIVGAGVAGLQAIATAKRLGAIVEAFDTRPAVEEQVKSLGAKFVKIDLGETGQTKDGYAKALTPEQLAKQREGIAKVCASSDIVITTAQVFGKKAPVIITKAMIEKMRPGSIIVDLAAENGGNVEGSKAGETVKVNGVTIIGTTNLPGKVAQHASQMYASNLYHFLNHFWDKKAQIFNLNLNDELLKGCVITHNSSIQNEMIKNLYQG